MIVGYVVGQALTIDTPVIASDSVNYIEARFVFLNRDWDGLAIHAIFDDGDVAYACPLKDGRVAQDNGLNLGAGTWQVHLVGSAMDGDVLVRRITTNPAKIEVVCAGRMDGEPVPPARYTDIEEIEAALTKKIDAPQTAAVGEVLTVEEVDAEGKPTKWKTAPAAAEQKQADWAQNDPTAADYVQNRPGGYYGDPVEVDEDLYSGEITSKVDELEVDFLFVAGQTYKVTIGGVEKTYTAFADTFQGISGVTIGDAPLMDAYTSGGGVWAMLSAEAKGAKRALMISLEEDVGKAIRIAHFCTLREVHKIPAELLDIPSVEQVPQVVTVRLVERDGKQYGSIPFNEVLAAQRGGKEVRLLDNDGHYFQFTGIYNADENICFHSFQQHKLWWAVMERSGLIEIYGYNLGQQELTYSAGSTYTSLYDEKSFSCSFFGSWTRMKFFITLRLLTRTAGAYVQLRYDKGSKILNICKHEEIGTDKAILCGELEKTTTGNYTYLVTLRLRSEDGTPHPARFDFCDELNLDSGETYSSPGIEILSGTEDKFASRQSVKRYSR